MGGGLFGPEFMGRLATSPQTRHLLSQPDFIHMIQDLGRNPNNMNKCELAPFKILRLPMQQVTLCGANDVGPVIRKSTLYDVLISHSPASQELTPRLHAELSRVGICQSTRPGKLSSNVTACVAQMSVGQGWLESAHIQSCGSGSALHLLLILTPSFAYADTWVMRGSSWRCQWAWA